MSATETIRSASESLAVVERQLVREVLDTARTVNAVGTVALPDAALLLGKAVRGAHARLSKTVAFVAQELEGLTERMKALSAAFALPTDDQPDEDLAAEARAVAAEIEAVERWPCVLDQVVTAAGGKAEAVNTPQGLQDAHVLALRDEQARQVEESIRAAQAKRQDVARQQQAERDARWAEEDKVALTHSPAEVALSEIDAVINEHVNDGTFPEEGEAADPAPTAQGKRRRGKKAA